MMSLQIPQIVQYNPTIVPISPLLSPLPFPYTFQSKSPSPQQSLSPLQIPITGTHHIHKPHIPKYPHKQPKKNQENSAMNRQKWAPNPTQTQTWAVYTRKHSISIIRSPLHTSKVRRISYKPYPIRTRSKSSQTRA